MRCKTQQHIYISLVVQVAKASVLQDCFALKAPIDISSSYKFLSCPHFQHSLKAGALSSKQLVQNQEVALASP